MTAGPNIKTSNDLPLFVWDVEHCNEATAAWRGELFDPTTLCPIILLYMDEYIRLYYLLVYST